MLYVFLIVSWEHNHFYSSHQIFQCQKCHDLIGFRILNGFGSNHASHHFFFSIPHCRHAGLLVREKICGHCGNILAPPLLIFFQRVSADVNSKHFFFKCQTVFLGIFLHIWHMNLKGRFFLFRNQVKQAHLSCHGIFLFHCHSIHNLDIYHHFLPPVSRKFVHGSCFDKVFNNLFIHFFSRHPLNEVLKMFKISSFFPFFHNSGNHGFSYAFNG